MTLIAFTAGIMHNMLLGKNSQTREHLASNPSITMLSDLLGNRAKMLTQSLRCEQTQIHFSFFSGSLLCKNGSQSN